MVFGADMDAWQAKPGQLEFVEKEKHGILPSMSEVKLLSITGVGYFMDAYDLFIINIIVPILQLVYYNNKTIPWGLSGGVLKAAANIGNVFGQLLFGFLGDALGRQAIYGKELILIIVAVIFIISVPDYLSPNGITGWITGFRFLMGIGIGGDYPMSASVVSDRANLKRRGALLGLVFSAQGWGNFVGALLAVIVIAAYQPLVEQDHLPHKLSGAWRILQGLSLIPAFATLYQRLSMKESTRFTEARKLQDDPSRIHQLTSSAGSDDGKEFDDSSLEDEDVTKTTLGLKPVGERSHFGEFFVYFSEWRHAKILIGTAICWFLVDIAFYGINLNQSFILTAINFTTGDPWTKLMKTATGNLIITAAGYLPGYYITIATIEILGRRNIQLIGFAMTSLFLGIAAGKFAYLQTHPGPFFVVFAFLQLFFNFGANATTFIIPAEVFPSRVRATAHGVSAATGKLGAILASLAFVQIAKDIGTDKVLYIFMAVSLAGIPFTFLIPETMNRDADLIDRQELAEAARAKGIPARQAEIVAAKQSNAGATAVPTPEAPVNSSQV